MKLLLYCTKAKPDLVDERKIKKEIPDNLFAIAMKDFMVYSTNQRGSFDYALNGKIVGECDFEVGYLRIVDDDPLGSYWYETKNLTENEILEKSCLNADELFDYLGEDNEGYAIHINNLHIFDEPKELSEFVTKRCQYAICSSCRYGKDNIKCSTIDNEVDKAPQNMMCCYGVDGKRYILISIRPEWLCKILNGEKTIEVRKKVLKEMLE